MNSPPLHHRESAVKSIEDLRRAVEWLDADPQATDRWVRLDAVAKRFEVSFEYFWRFLKASLQFQGTEAPGPRPAIQGAITYGWIDEPEEWASFLEGRNAGVHDYFGLSSEEYAGIARRYLTKAAEVLDRIKF